MQQGSRGYTCGLPLLSLAALVITIGPLYFLPWLKLWFDGKRADELNTLGDSFAGFFAGPVVAAAAAAWWMTKKQAKEAREHAAKIEELSLEAAMAASRTGFTSAERVFASSGQPLPFACVRRTGPVEAYLLRHSDKIRVRNPRNELVHGEKIVETGDFVFDFSSASDMGGEMVRFFIQTLAGERLMYEWTYVGKATGFIGPTVRRLGRASIEDMRRVATVDAEVSWPS